MATFEEIKRKYIDNSYKLFIDGKWVDAIDGYEKKVLPLNTVIRFWGNIPEEPAPKVVWMASSATDRRNGLMVNFLSLGRMMAGVGKELWRLLTRGSIKTPTLQVRVTEK